MVPLGCPETSVTNNATYHLRIAKISFTPRGSLKITLFVFVFVVCMFWLSRDTQSAYPSQMESLLVCLDLPKLKISGDKSSPDSGNCEYVTYCKKYFLFGLYYSFFLFNNLSSFVSVPKSVRMWNKPFRITQVKSVCTSCSHPFANQ
jgi:hypothetical protein